MVVKAEVFTKERLEYIIDNLFFKTAAELKNEFGMSSEELRTRLQLVIDSGQFISEEYKGMKMKEIIRGERIKLMKRYEGKKSLSQLSMMLGVTETQVRQYAKECDIKLEGVKNYAKFTEEDIQYIIDNVMKKGAKYIAVDLERYTEDQVRHKIVSLIKNGAFGEDKKDMNSSELRRTLRIEKLSELEDNKYHIGEVAEIIGSCRYTAVTLSEVAGLKLIRKVSLPVDTIRKSKEFYNIPTSEIDLEKMTYEEWYRRWFHTYRNTGIREPTKKHYYNTWLKIHETQLGQMRLIDINRNHVQAYANDYGKSRSKNTVLDHMQLIRSSFKDAHLDGHIKVNHAGNVRIAYKEQSLSIQEQKRLRDEKKWLEVDEYEKFKNFIVSRAEELLSSSPKKVHDVKGSKGVLFQTHFMIMLTLLKTGARYSEVMGLTRSDLIQSRPYRINIDKTWDHKKFEGGTFVPTKNIASIREVSIDDETATLLDKYINWLDEYGIETEEDTLFNLSGRRIFNSDSNIILKSTLNELGIEPVSAHKLRHTMASYLISKGVDLMVVAKRLGHTDSSMVMKVYGHLLKETEDEHNEKIMQLL